MEILYQPETMFTQQSGVLAQGSLHQQGLFVSPREVYSYYSYDTPSRTPTPEQLPPKPYSPPSHTKTLQSVLMGEVPAAYSHLTSSSPLQRPLSRTSSMGSPSSTESVQTEPMDLSFKRSPNPYSCAHSDRSDVKCHQDGQFSLLRNLLSVGKSSSSCQMERMCESPSSQDSWPMHTVTGSTRVTLAKKNMFPVCARVSNWLVKVVHFAKSIPEFINLSHDDKLTLILNSWSRLLLLCMAESNFQFAVTPLQSQYVVSSESPAADEPTMKSVEGVQSFIRKCQHMDVETKEYAFLKMLVLFNAVLLYGGEMGVLLSAAIMKVCMHLVFIELGKPSLRYIGLDRPEVIDKLNLSVQQLLQQHVVDTRPDDVMHYSRLLLSLPSLYGIDHRMIENLFCRHLNKNTDMEVLLKEILQNL
ncbi:COUP transcription factor 2-like [Gigantopelta aegis]|uniref:COUP transcription factor 2-like n=1 Tax=Gigantopelta aegis TaxID=1735272 RepID=UPI001B88ADF9|nr:COUP transcription factor 2-like [Gigantopelta aegis]